MAIFGRSFPFPRRYVSLPPPGPVTLTGTWSASGTGAASWVGVPLLKGKIVQPHRLPDRPRPKLGVFIGRSLHSLQTATWTSAGIGAATWTSNAIAPATQSIVRPHRLADRPRPKLGVFIGHGVRFTIASGTWSAAGTGAATWTGAAKDAATWTSAGSGAVSWTAATTLTGALGATGSGTALWVSAPTSHPGGAGYVIRFTRKRYEEWREQLEAERKALQKIADEAKPERRKIIQKALRVSGLLSDALGDAGDGPEIDHAAEVHRANVAALSAARTRAATAAQAAILIAHVERVLAELEEEELSTLLLLN